MKEVREKIMPLADLLEYQIRVGKISYAGGDKIWRTVLKNPDLVNAVLRILEDELPEDEVMAKFERLL